MEVIPVDALNDQGDGTFTATVGAHPLLSRNHIPPGQPGSEPAQAGDVLSCQPDGTLQSRPKDTSGAYERLVTSGTLAVFRPDGARGRTFAVGYYAGKTPNT
jgi:hypothetical protein